MGDPGEGPTEQGTTGDDDIETQNNYFVIPIS